MSIRISLQPSGFGVRTLAVTLTVVYPGSAGSWQTPEFSPAADADG